MNLNIFRAYDIRGVFGVDFEPRDFYRIACVYTDCFQPKTVAVGHDVRERSPELWRQVVSGFQDSGVDVLDLGRISTDMLYFAVVHYQMDGGIVITASHNPAAFNGMKLVGQHAVPISADTGLFAVRDAVRRGTSFAKQNGHCRGNLWAIPFLDAYLSHLRSFVDLRGLSEKRIVLNANSGLAGKIADRLLVDTPIQVCQRLFTEPDGSFAEIPGGRPDPLRPENRELTTAAVQQTRADLAVAWDADADRCFFFDETGAFVEGCYITALLAEKFLRQRRGGIIFDPRAMWAVEHTVLSNKGRPILSRCGHSFIKAGMRESRALFGGEASGHYYFRDNFYADNGMIPFLLVLEYLSVQRMSLAEAVNPLRAAYPISGEINFAFETNCQIREALDAVNAAIHCWGDPCLEAPIDGLSVRFLSGSDGWRFNLRESNTEPLLRLNVETIGDEDLLIEKTMQISEKLEYLGGKRETKCRWETEKLA
ncbi:MAG: phosphomannomutase/phosphoglucomutase [Candidatus Poribacteria bacterium]|nr:phosphomannomutase/phosphoglucomutase [Candidatus Poribacteria bacterium]